MPETKPAVAAKPTQLDSYWAEVLPPQKAANLYRSLPAHIKPAVFERNLLNAFMASPELMQFPPALVYREIAKAAALGLYLDPLLGEAYIVIAYNYKTKRQEPQLRVGYKGFMKLARQTGNVTTIYCHEVHAFDEVEADFGHPLVFHHRPRLFTERGPIVGYAALIAFKDGNFDFEPMSLKQCYAVRDRSDAWKAYKENKIRSTPWSTDENEMCKKTNLRRLLKRQEQSPEIVRANQIEDEADYGVSGVQAPHTLRLEGPSMGNESEMIATAPEEQAQQAEGQPETTAPVNPETGEVSPHTIARLDRESGVAMSWQEWGSMLIAAVKAAESDAEINLWIERNQGHMGDFKRDAPLVFGRLEDAITKHRNEVKAKAGGKKETKA